MSVNMSAWVIMRVLPKVVAYVRKDLAKRYSLLEPWELRLTEPLPGEYISKRIFAVGYRLVIRGYISTKDDAICDGNTLVPEEILGIKTEIGALVHDPLYLELEPFAGAMGWTVGATRKFADTIYGNILLQLARRETGIRRAGGVVWAHLSYISVRALGGVAHWAYGLGLVIGVGLSCAGCGGCMAIVVEDDWQTPIYRQENTSTNTVISIETKVGL